MVQYKSYKLKNGQTRWEYRGYFGIDNKTGNVIRPEKSGFKSKAEAKLHYERTIEQLKNNTINKGRIKFDDLYQEFLPFYESTGVVQSTCKKFKEEYTKHIKPEIGHYYVDAITITDCQHMVEAIKKKRKDFRKVIGHARTIFKYGVQERYISDNPLDKVIITPSKEKYVQRRVSSQENYYEPSDLMKFLDFYREHGNFHEFVYFRLLAFSGLRRGEALALEKKSINYANKSIKIESNLVEDINGRTTIARYLKTDNSEAIVYLDDYTFSLIDELVKQTKFTLAHHTHVEITNSQYIFTSPKSGSHYHRHAPNEWLKRFWSKHSEALHALGLKYVSPHGFRHSQATLLHELGVNPKDAQHRLRHKNLKTTMDIYTHLSQNKERLVTQQLNDFSAGVGKTLGKIIPFKTKTS